MGIWRRRDDRDFERRLRAGRPLAREELVEMLASQLPTPRRSPRSRRGTLGRVVLILAVTAAIAGSLGVAGAIGYATHSVSTFGTNVEHIFSPPGPQTTNSNSGEESKNDGTKGDNDDNNNGGEGDPFKDPFHFVYGTELPICDPSDTLQFVSLFEWFHDIFTPGYSFASFDPSTQTFYCPPRT